MPSPDSGCDQRNGRQGATDERDHFRMRTSVLGSLVGGALRSIGGFDRALGMIQHRLHLRQAFSALAIGSLRVSSTATSFVWTRIKGTSSVG
jgi:hypothetical protein